MEYLENILSWIGRTSRLIQIWRWIKMWFNLPKKVQAIENEIKAKREARNGVHYCPNCDQRLKVVKQELGFWKYFCASCNESFSFKRPG